MKCGVVTLHGQWTVNNMSLKVPLLQNGCIIQVPIQYIFAPLVQYQKHFLSWLHAFYALVSPLKKICLWQNLLQILSKFYICFPINKSFTQLKKTSCTIWSNKIKCISANTYIHRWIYATLHHWLLLSPCIHLFTLFCTCCLRYKMKTVTSTTNKSSKRNELPTHMQSMVRDSDVSIVVEWENLFVSPLPFTSQTSTVQQRYLCSAHTRARDPCITASEDECIGTCTADRMG